MVHVLGYSYDIQNNFGVQLTEGVYWQWVTSLDTPRTSKVTSVYRDSLTEGVYVPSMLCRPEVPVMSTCFILNYGNI